MRLVLKSIIQRVLKVLESHRIKDWMLEYVEDWCVFEVECVWEEIVDQKI